MCLLISKILLFTDCLLIILLIDIEIIIIYIGTILENYLGKGEQDIKKEYQKEVRESVTLSPHLLNFEDLSFFSSCLHQDRIQTVMQLQT